jgi:hypothetical protein
MTQALYAPMNNKRKEKKKNWCFIVGVAEGPYQPF